MPHFSRGSSEAGSVIGVNGGTFELPATLTPRRITTPPVASLRWRPSTRNSGEAAAGASLAAEAARERASAGRSAFGRWGAWARRLIPSDHGAFMVAVKARGDHG